MLGHSSLCEKTKMVYETLEDKQYNNPKTGVMSDTMIKLTGQKPRNNIQSHYGGSYSMTKRRTARLFSIRTIQKCQQKMSLCFISTDGASSCSSNG